MGFMINLLSNNITTTRIMIIKTSFVSVLIRKSFFIICIDFVLNLAYTVPYTSLRNWIGSMAMMYLPSSVNETDDSLPTCWAGSELKRL
jgi:hypothetical protein